jgi:cbb3-type cytochrome oxidase cytochrome c subunit
MAPYMMRKNPAIFPKDKPDDARSALPPPLVRQGERVQPDWMYRFLLNPTVIRPQNWVILRMPKFNMSPDEARALVNYFAAVSRMTNPGAGITFPYVQVEQREADYWKDRAEGYARQPQRQKALIKDLQGRLAKVDAKKAAAEAEDLKKRIQAAEARLKVMEALLGKETPAPKEAKYKDAYSRHAFSLLQDRNLCLQCHNIGAVRTSDPPKGPDLTLSAERLRPEWVEQWMANPKRLFPYQPLMPQNFPNEPGPEQYKFQNVFVGSPRQQIQAVRDILMAPDRLADLIAHRPPAPPEPKKNGDKK